MADGIELALSKEGAPVYEPRTWDEVVEEHIDYYERIVAGDA
jgi:hypothetical protein